MRVLSIIIAGVATWTFTTLFINYIEKNISNYKN